MKRMFFVLVLFVWICQILPAQDNTRYLALFVYNFTRYIEWPSKSSNEFVIAVIGKSRVYEELQTISQGKSIGSQTITVKKVQSLDELKACNVLFVSNDASSKIAELVSQTKDFNTLIITERSGLTSKGAGISFVIDDGKQRFEINKSNLEKVGLRVNKALIDMALNNG
jgi:hypothetical protein